MLKHRIFVLWSVSPVAKLAILFSTIQLHPCPQHQSPWRTLSCFQVYFFLVRLPVAVGLDDEYPLSFLIHCRQHPSSWLQRIPGSAYIQRLSFSVGLSVDSLSVFCNNHRSIWILYCSVSMVILSDIWFFAVSSDPACWSLYDLCVFQSCSLPVQIQHTSGSVSGF